MTKMFYFLDINECNDSALCEERCNNTDGGYNCECSEGYTLNSDNRTCEGTLSIRTCLEKKCLQL